VLARLAAVAVGSIARVPVLGTMDKLGGLVVGAVRGALIVLALVWVLNVVPIPSLENAVGSSGIARAFLQVAPRLYQHIKEVINPQLLQGRWPILRPNTLK
ncbi:MAG TPA: CvpA family protein, partial [Bacillota bacterium]|nr:CvpA family protein [Bacillota bacterium]